MLHALICGAGLKHVTDRQFIVIHCSLMICLIIWTINIGYSDFFIILFVAAVFGDILRPLFSLQLFYGHLESTHTSNIWQLFLDV